MDVHPIGLEATIRDRTRLSEAQWARRRAALEQWARPRPASRGPRAVADVASVVLLAASLLCGGQGGGGGHTP